MNTPFDLTALTFTEFFNFDIAKKIVENFNKVVCQLSEERQKKINEKKTEFDFTKCLKKMIKEGHNKIITNYKPSKNLKTKGRLFAQNASLQSLPREFRGALAKGLYWDLDIKNAHPVLLAQYCHKNDIRCDALDYYIKNRDEVLNDIMTEYDYTRDEAKDLFLMGLNGCKREGLINRFYANYQKEMAEIHKIIIIKNHNLYKELKNRKDFNLEGSTTNIILCELENLMITWAFTYLMSIGLKVDVLVFDGIMVRKDKNEPFDLTILKNLSDFIKDKTGYDVEFIEKPLDDTIDISLINDNNTNMYSDIDLTGKYIIDACNDDEGASSYVIGKNYNYIVYCNETLLVKKENYWVSDKKEVDRALSNMIVNAEIYYYNQKRTALCHYSRSVSHQNKCVISIRNNKLVKTDDNLLDNISISNKGYLPFKNGIWCMKEKKLYKYDELPQVNFLNIICRDLNDFNQDEYDEFMNRVVNPILPNQIEKDYFAHITSRAIAGHCEDKRWYGVSGFRFCGKSVLTDCMKGAFGKYFNTFNAKCLVNNRFGNPEASRALGWLAEHLITRALWSNEIDADENKDTLNGNLIKTIASGGDAITVRKLYENEITFTPQFTVTLLFNDMCKIEPADVLENYIEFACKSKFVSKEELTPELPHYKLKDDKIKIYIREDKAINAFTWWILNNYDDILPIPECVVRSNDAITKVDTKITPELFIAKSFKVSKSKHDVIYMDDLKTILEENEFSLSSQKINRIMSSLQIGIYCKDLKCGDCRKAGFKNIIYNKSVAV